MKVNNFNFFSLGGHKIVKLFSLVIVVFMMGTLDVSAQYVPKDQAIQRLESEITVLSHTPGYPSLTPYVYTLTLYYKQIIGVLTSDNAPEVGYAIKTALQHFGSGPVPQLTNVRINHPVISKTELNNMYTSAVQLLSI